MNAGPLRTISVFSAHPGKRAVEKLWLGYTLVWGALCAVVMLGGFAERYGDLELMTLGAGIALPAMLVPLRLRADEERDLPLRDTAGFKLTLSVVAFSVLLNYTQTPFFFDVLHAHFGFRSTINIRHNPVFLYLMTIAYFSTYAVLLMMAYRVSQQLLAATPRLVRLLGAGLACLVVAALETLLNANPFMRHLYCFDDMRFALWFGSLAYGISFLCILPVWIGIDEEPMSARASSGTAPRVRSTWQHTLVCVLAAVYADSLALDLLRFHVAPHFTTVHEGAVGLGVTPGSCLAVP